jgi:lauroyl/myristoyl acyltransferase
MRTISEAAKWLWFHLTRSLERAVPPGLLWYLVSPLPAAQALRDSLAYPGLPPRRLPPALADRRPSFRDRWRYQLGIHSAYMLLLWPDRMTEPRWSRRFSDDGGERLDALLVQGPVVLVTIHTRGLIALSGWLQRRGIAVGNVVLGDDWYTQPAKIRKGALVRQVEGSAAFRPGAARAMLRFLTPGRALVLPADHPLGHQVDGLWQHGRLRLSTGGLRLARQGGAAVVPVVIVDDGRWRFRVHVGQPVPDGAIRGGDQQAAADHIASDLMPLVASRPELALLTLVEALSPASPDGSASGLGALPDGKRDR